MKTWASAVSFQSTCVLATATTSRAKPGWSGKLHNDMEDEGTVEGNDVGNNKESEKKASKGSSDLRPVRPNKERAMVFLLARVFLLTTRVSVVFFLLCCLK